MQVGEVLLRPARPLERVDVGLHLDQVAGDEARGEAEMTQGLNQEPAGVAAGAGAGLERVFRLLHARLQPDAIGDHPLQPRIEVDDEAHRALRLPRQFGEEGFEQRACRFHRQAGRELFAQLRRIGEGKGFGLRRDEEVERVDDRQLGDEIDLDAELADRLGKDEARQPVAGRVLLPVHEMLRGRDLQRVAFDPGPAVRRRPQPHGLGAERDRPVVAVMRDVVQRGDDGQAPPP
ncbi:hypothetical protein BTHI11S_02507 [Bosea thiooxidans]